MSTLEKHRIWQYLGVSTIILAVFFALGQNYIRISITPDLHTLFDLTATLLAVFIGSLSLLRFYTKKDNLYLFLGAAFLGNAFLDGFHTFMLEVFFDVSNDNTLYLITEWSFSTSRIFLAILMFFSWVVWKQNQNREKTKNFSDRSLYLFVAGFTLFFFLLYSFYPFLESQNIIQLMEKPNALISALFFALAFWGYFSKGLWKKDVFEHFILISLLIGFFSQALFINTSLELFDRFFTMGNILKLISYLSVFIGILYSVYQVFKELEDSQKQLHDSYHQLKEMSHLKDEFISVASHELRTPMTIIKGYSALLLDESCGKIEPAQKKFLEKIRDNTSSLIELVNDMLDINKLESGKMSFEYDDFLLHEIVSEVYESFTPYYAEKNITLLYSPYYRQNIKVWVDKDKIHRVFHNLLGNAFKFTDEGGKVAIIISDNTDDSSLIKIEIRDSGIGIPEEKQKEIFEKFTQVDNPLQRKCDGTGLGLSIVKSMVESGGGNIWLKSQENKGSSFFFTLPKTPED